MFTDLQEPLRGTPSSVDTHFWLCYIVTKAEEIAEELPNHFSFGIALVEAKKGPAVDAGSMVIVSGSENRSMCVRVVFIGARHLNTTFSSAAERLLKDISFHSRYARRGDQPAFCMSEWRSLSF